jgi:hypothetical protein
MSCRGSANWSAIAARSAGSAEFFALDCQYIDQSVKYHGWPKWDGGVSLTVQVADMASTRGLRVGKFSVSRSIGAPACRILCDNSCTNRVGSLISRPSLKSHSRIGSSDHIVGGHSISISVCSVMFLSPEAWRV